MFRPFDKIQNLFPIFAETETQMNTAHILSRPLKRSLCERKIRTFAFFVHSVPQKAKTV